MSRKSRNREKPELVRDESADDDLAHGATVHRLTGDLHDTLETLITGCALIAQGSDPLAMLDVAMETLDDDLDDIIGDETIDEEVIGDEAIVDELNDQLDARLDVLDDALVDLARTIRLLARALVARALGQVPPAIGPHTIPPETRLSRAERSDAFDEAAFVVREVGLEEHDMWCELALGADGTPELYTQPLAPENAHLSLLEFLFDRAEVLALEIDPLLNAERDAWSWEFSRWSVSPPPGIRSPDAANLSRPLREQEHSLVDRRSVALGTSVIGDFVTNDGFAEQFPRQHRMAGALAASIIDVFECAALEGNRATFRSVRSGQTYDVFEYMDPIEYSTGWICAGRLLPFDGALHLRSPGMIFVHLARPDVARDAAASLDLLGQTLPPALAVEGTISSVLFGVSVPRAQKPAPSRAAARESLAALRAILAAEEIEREIEEGIVADAQRSGIERPAKPDIEIQPDPTLVEFMAALAEQGEAGGARREKQRARRRKKTKRRR